jgi:hypothetical protein
MPYPFPNLHLGSVFMCGKLDVNLDPSYRCWRQQYLLRTEFQGKAYEAFKVLGLRPPEKFQVLAEPVKQEAKEANIELV